MAAKINKTVTISLKDGSMGPVGSGKTVPGPGNVTGGGTTSQGKGAGFKTKNNRGGAPTAQGPDYDTARGIQANKGMTGRSSKGG